MSLALAANGFQPIAPGNCKLVPCYLPGIDEAGNNVAGYPGDLVVAVAAGARILRSNTATAQTGVIGVLDNYIASGAAAAWYTLISPEGDFTIQSGIAQSSLSWAVADIGSGASLYCAAAEAAPDTNALRSGLRIQAKDTSNGCLVFTGLARNLGNDLASSASNYPVFMVRFLKSAIFPYSGDI